MRIHSDVVFRVLGDGAVLVNLSSNEIFELNETGTAILTLVAEGRSPAGIAEHLVTIYALDPAQAESEVRELLDRLQALGLVTP